VKHRAIDREARNSFSIGLDDVGGGNCGSFNSDGAERAVGESGAGTGGSLVSGLELEDEFDCRYPFC